MLIKSLEETLLDNVPKKNLKKKMKKYYRQTRITLDKTTKHDKKDIIRSKIKESEE